MASAQMTNQGCPANDSGLRLPPGFCASVLADRVGHARHLVVAPNGTAVAAYLWGLSHRNPATPKTGGNIPRRQ